MDESVIHLNLCLLGVNKMFKWDADEYQKNSSAQQKWARELIKKMDLK